MVGIMSVTVANAAGPESFGDVSQNVTGSISGLGLLVTAGSYLAGLAFTISAIFKFKQHKDNPTQVSIGQAVGILLIAISFLFFPSIMSSMGSTMFGSAAKTAGPKGLVWCSVEASVTSGDTCQ